LRELPPFALDLFGGQGGRHRQYRKLPEKEEMRCCRYSIGRAANVQATITLPVPYDHGTSSHGSAGRGLEDCHINAKVTGDLEQYDVQLDPALD
jgi:hypothetical protein